MPYRRRYVKRRRTYKKKPWYKRKYSAMEIASKAYSTAKYLRGMINSEKKIADHNNSAVTISGSGTTVTLSDIAQGDGNSTRDGNSLLCKALYGTIKVIPNASATTSTMVRFAIIQDKQQVADTTPLYNDIFQSADPISYLDRATVGRYTILWQKQCTLNVTDKTARILKFYTRVNNHIRYNGTADTDIQKNGIWLVCCSDDSTYAPTMNYAIRLTFYDN